MRGNVDYRESSSQQLYVKMKSVKAAPGESDLWDQLMSSFQINVPKAPSSSPYQGKQQALAAVKRSHDGKPSKLPSKPKDFEKEWIASHLTEANGSAVSRDKIFDRYVEDCWEHKHPPVKASLFSQLISASFPNSLLRKFGSRVQAQFYFIGLQLIADLPKPVTPAEIPTSGTAPQAIIPIDSLRLIPQPQPEPEIQLCQVPCVASPRLEVVTSADGPVSLCDADVAVLGQLAAECLSAKLDVKTNWMPVILWDLGRWSEAVQFEALIVQYNIPEADVVSFLLCLRSHLLLVGTKVTRGELDDLATSLTEFWITCNPNVQIRKIVLQRLTKCPPMCHFISTVYLQFYANLVQVVAPRDRILTQNVRFLEKLLGVLDNWMVCMGRAFPGMIGGAVIAATFGFVCVLDKLLRLNNSWRKMPKEHGYSQTTRELMEQLFTGVCISTKGQLQTLTVQCAEILWTFIHESASRYGFLSSIEEMLQNSDIVQQTKDAWEIILSVMESNIPSFHPSDHSAVETLVQLLLQCVAYFSDKATAREQLLSPVEYFSKTFAQSMPALSRETDGKGHIAVDYYVHCLARGAR
ncbi:DNA-binding protein RFX2-like isoform X2 [Paramacrobiotus metropolitanus]|uniref:DNA-binding protein RFX2-like isoform X2 n=1 Tax=Paramacrobiotus metropolitanus TaxID=2943436 RepID=UPI0024459147|nr:DNA-binding protein RFX2-like isoform X2 [Paramacrobiotus metropolitanus]